MNIEWLKNKTKEKFYPITHAKAVLFGENNRTVNDEIEQIKNDLSKVKQVTGTTSDGGNLLDSTFAKNTYIIGINIVNNDKYYIVTPITIDNKCGGFHITNSEGTVVANQSVTLNVLYREL